MQTVEKKADFLITLVGTSAMPNLIGIVTRINQCGKVFLIHTCETKDISDSLENFIEQKNKADIAGNLHVKSESVKLGNYDNPQEVYRELLPKFKSICREIKNSGIDKPVIELNYTGGTKVISSLSCKIFDNVFENFDGSLYFTYLDGEKSEIHIFKSSLNRESIVDYSSKNGTIPITVGDVAAVHMKSVLNYKDSSDTFRQSKFSKDMYDFIVNNLDKRKEIISYLEGLFNGLTVIKKATQITDFLNAFSDKNKLLYGYDNSNDFLEAFYTKSIKKVSEKLRGKWFEEVIHQILIELKRENVIDDFANNLSSTKSINTNFESDFIAMKDYKLYYFSVSTVDTEEMTRLKLYEAKQRVKIISDAESAAAAVTFVEDKNEILKGYKNIWQENPKNVLITTWNELPKLKEIIRNWIMKKGAVDENEY
ncbi:hypothetical protein LN736_08650 [Clostridium sp. WLY-B-L2]|uniref:CRISPR-associated protein n=1 Tax=Clostridium aromativorans TaxID=2836848 RepID=A0ABS8N555_9CLOT|nr:hypothetical protein [Clostridium aromativorans]MCC9294922.1 hypothetical protein [Clostridium aromativorans]